MLHFKQQTPKSPVPGEGFTPPLPLPGGAGSEGCWRAEDTHPPMLAPCWFYVGLCWLYVGSMLAQVGSMLAYDGSSWLYLGPKTAQDRQMLAQVGLQTPKMPSKGLQDAPTWPPNGLQMASKSTCLTPCLFFHNFQKY